jgi:hypothetical protein
MKIIFAGKVLKTGFFQKAGFQGNSERILGIFRKSNFHPGLDPESGLLISASAEMTDKALFTLCLWMLRFGYSDGWQSVWKWRARRGAPPLFAGVSRQ